MTVYVEKLTDEWVTDVNTLRLGLRDDNDLKGVLPLMLHKALKQRLRAVAPSFDAEDKENCSTRSKQQKFSKRSGGTAKARNIANRVGLKQSGKENRPKVNGAAQSTKKRGGGAVGYLLQKLKVIKQVHNGRDVVFRVSGAAPLMKNVLSRGAGAVGGLPEKLKGGKPVIDEGDIVFECKAITFSFFSTGPDKEGVTGATMH